MVPVNVNASEPAVTNEEVLFQVLHHALNLAFGSGPPRFASSRGEAVVFRQHHEARVEDKVSVMVFHYRRFLVINQHGFHAATEVTEGANQRFIGMFSILPRSCKNV